MLPELFHIGSFAVRPYGLMLALSFIMGVWYVQRAVARDKKPFDPYLSIASYMIFGGIIGARLVYVLLHLEEFTGNWLATISPVSHNSRGDIQIGIAGLNLYGGVLLAILFTVIYCRVKKLPLLEVFDYFAPTLGIGLAITRIGCFLNGCCFGKPTDLPWGIVFPDHSIPADTYAVEGLIHPHLHPTQLYSSLYGLGLFLLLNFMIKRKKFTGQLVAILFMCEAVFRFFIEYVRYYEPDMMIQGTSFTWNQVIAVGLFIAGTVIYVVQRRRSPVISAA
jgi:phosphatidylglycerol---prolipoprotein diacylglyceryl transferase